jgi:hypothetical protein
MLPEQLFHIIIFAIISHQCPGSYVDLCENSCMNGAQGGWEAEREAMRQDLLEYSEALRRMEEVGLRGGGWRTGEEGEGGGEGNRRSGFGEGDGGQERREKEEEKKGTGGQVAGRGMEDRRGGGRRRRRRRHKEV